MSFYRYTYYPSNGNIKVSFHDEGIMVEELATYSLNSNNYIFYKDYSLDNDISKKEFIMCCRLELENIEEKITQEYRREIDNIKAAKKIANQVDMSILLDTINKSDKEQER